MGPNSAAALAATRSQVVRVNTAGRTGDEGEDIGLRGVVRGAVGGAAPAIRCRFGAAAAVDETSIGRIDF